MPAGRESSTLLSFVTKTVYVCTTNTVLHIGQFITSIVIETIQNFLCKYIFPFEFLFVSNKESLFQGSYSKITVISRAKTRLVYVESKTKKKKKHTHTERNICLIYSETNDL